MSTRYFIELSYKGNAFHGWQLQQNAASIQSEINNALSLISSEKIETTGAGRTDTGVHAKEYFAHFDSSRDLTFWKNAIYHVNCILHDDIAVKNFYRMHDNAHARFDATSRTYEYHLYTFKDPFLNDHAFFLKGHPDIVLMNEAAQLLKSYTDFKCFSKSRTQVNNYNCRIMQASWKQEQNTMIFTIKADRFLRNMVRAVTGTLLEVGMNKIDIPAFKNIIESRNRSDAGMSVPACGLYLTKIDYPENYFKHPENII